MHADSKCHMTLLVGTLPVDIIHVATLLLFIIIVVYVIVFTQG